MHSAGLTSAQATGTLAYTETLTYDVAGRIYTKTGPGTFTYPSTGTPVHGVIETDDGSGGANDYVYDKAGNMIERDLAGENTVFLVYDAENRMVEVQEEITSTATTQFEFLYDGNGNRVWMKDVQTGDETYYLGNYYQVLDTTDDVEQSYYYANGQRVAMREHIDTASPAVNEVYFLFGDHLGSTSIVGDDGGNKISEIRYTAWGEVRYSWYDSSSVPGIPTDYTYTGQRDYTSKFGLMDFVARFYDPYLNHFTQPDNIIPNPGNPSDWNRFAYVRYNPIMYSDPSGHNPECGPDGVWCDGVATADDYFYTFTDVGLEWKDINKEDVLNAVHSVAKMLGKYMGTTAGMAWTLVFGPMTFQMGGCEKCNGVGAYAASSELIQFATFPLSSRKDRTLRARNLVTHELGHAFSQGHDLQPQTELGDYQLGESTFPNRPNFPDPTPKGWVGDRHGFASEQNVLTWQLSVSNAGYPAEEFADMFLGWTYSKWDASKAGVDRANYMRDNMAKYLNSNWR